MGPKVRESQEEDPNPALPDCSPGSARGDRKGCSRVVGPQSPSWVPRCQQLFDLEVSYVNLLKQVKYGNNCPGMTKAFHLCEFLGREPATSCHISTKQKQELALPTQPSIVLPFSETHVEAGILSPQQFGLIHVRDLLCCIITFL